MERFEAVEPELEFIGSPDTVAERMGRVMEAVGGDGFLISTLFQRTSRRFITEVAEGLVPALQRRGLARTAYTGTTLREVLREFRHVARCLLRQARSRTPKTIRGTSG